MALDVELPNEVTQFGFGYAILATVPVANAATVELFNGTTSLGSLSYNGVLDPTFTGGFAGVESTIPFTRARLTFNQVGSAFAVDNVRFSAQAVPEPSSLGLAAMGIACGFAILARQRRRRLWVGPCPDGDLA